jgi:hypothetical protein
MPVNTSNPSSWNSTQPSGSSSIRQGDDLIRADKVLVQSVLADEHYFDGTSASSLSGGVHKKGSARVFTGTRASLATPASADSDGRLYYSTDLGSLHVLQASSHSTLVGGSRPFGAKAVLTGQARGSGAAISTWSSAGGYDVGGFLNVSVASLTVPAGLAGHYMLAASVMFPSDATGSSKSIAIVEGNAFNNNKIVAAASANSGFQGATWLSCTGIEQASAGSYYNVFVFHDAGSPSIGSAYFSIQKFA